MLDGKKRFAECQLKPRPLFSMCLLEDANSVQVSIMQVLSLLGSGQMEPKTAGLMLYGLQIANANLRRTSFEPTTANDVVIDRNTIAHTSIDGPQWFEEDFESAQEDEEEDEQPSNEQQSEEETEPMIQSGKPEGETDPNVALVAKHLQAEAHRMDTQEETRQTVAAARKKVHAVISNYVLEAVRTVSAASRDKPN
jgi:hypothetical protein